MIYIGKPRSEYMIAGKIGKGQYICIKGTYFIGMLGEMTFEQAMAKTKEYAEEGLEELPVVTYFPRPIFVTVGGEKITLKDFLRRLSIYKMNLLYFYP